jgi:hypothetical protein
LVVLRQVLQKLRKERVHKLKWLAQTCGLLVKWAVQQHFKA